MSTDHWPKPRGFTPDRIQIPSRFGDGIVMDREVTGGSPAPPRVMRRRRVTLERRAYIATSAHDLLDATSELGRPGMPY